MIPTIGHIVHYTLTSGDAEQINRRRDDAAAFRLKAMQSAVERGDWGRSGHVEHHGNAVGTGDVFPAVVVRTSPSTTVNLKVLLDGNDDYWATSRAEGHGFGHWHWPAHAEETAEASAAAASDDKDFEADPELD